MVLLGLDDGQFLFLDPLFVNFLFLFNIFFFNFNEIGVEALVVLIQRNPRGLRNGRLLLSLAVLLLEVSVFIRL